MMQKSKISGTYYRITNLDIKHRLHLWHFFLFKINQYSDVTALRKAHVVICLCQKMHCFTCKMFFMFFVCARALTFAIFALQEHG